MSSLMLHKHRILPGHMGGTYEPDNVLKLTVKEHAEEHRVLWAVFGRQEDRVAWLGLGGQISPTEAQIEAMRLAGKRRGAANKGLKRSPETRAKISAAQKGTSKSLEARINMMAAQNCPEVKMRISAAMKVAWTDPTVRARIFLGHLRSTLVREILCAWEGAV